MIPSVPMMKVAGLGSIGAVKQHDRIGQSASPIARSGVLRDAVAEGPVLLLDLDEIDESVLARESDALVQPVDDCLVESLLDLDPPSLVEG